MRPQYLVLILVLFLVSCAQRPVCGNGIIEQGETMQTCCEDTGCLGQQNCLNHFCFDPVCGDCKYLWHHVCMNYACCQDADCDDSNPSTRDSCINPATEMARCMHAPIEKRPRPACYRDEDCDDLNAETKDVCLKPGTKDARCAHQLIEAEPPKMPVTYEDGIESEQLEQEEYVEQDAFPCKDNDNFCSWECNSWKLDSDCGVPKIYDFVEHRSPSQYLNSNIIHWDDESWRNYAPLINKVQQLTQGLTTDLDKAESISLWVRNSKQYGFPSPANERKSIIDIFHSPTGVCMDAALLTTAMFRLAGIPARAIMPTDTSHEISEAYINSKWIGFDTVFTCSIEQDPNCVSDELIHAGPLTVFSYNNELFGTDKVFTESVGGLFLRDIKDVKYFKVNVIQRPMYKNVNMRVQFSWNWKNDKQIVDKKCFFAYLGEPETEITNPPVVISVDRDFILHCSVGLSDYSEQHEIKMGKIRGEDLIISLVQATDYVDTQSSVISKDVDTLGWGEVYYPISSKLLFKNTDGSLSFDYDQNKYADFTAIGEYFRADNLDCDRYSCRYVESNGYSQRLQTVGILGYGTFESGGQIHNTMVPDHHNGYAKILMPAGNYKLVYMAPFEGDFGHVFFKVNPGSKTVLTPNTLQRSSSPEKFDILVSALKESVEGLNPY